MYNTNPLQFYFLGDTGVVCRCVF